MSLLAVHRSGPADAGTPLVLLHGFPLDSRMWQPVVDLVPDLPTLAIDLPGLGSSPTPEAVAAALGLPNVPSLDVSADAVAATLRAAGVERAVVAGLSMGGYVALALAERHRELFAGIALLDTMSAADAEGAREARLRIAAEAEGESGAGALAGMAERITSPGLAERAPEVLARLRQWIANAPPAAIAWSQRAMAARPDRLAVIADLAVPGLVLRGVDDALASAEAAEAMAAALSGGGHVERVEVSDAGHMTTIENPEPVAQALHGLWRRAAR